MIRVNDRSFKLASSIANVVAGNAVPLTGLATGESFTLTAKGSASTFDERQVDEENNAITFNTGLSPARSGLSRLERSASPVSNGLTHQEYFVTRISDNTIKLATTLAKATSGDPSNAVDLKSPPTPALTGAGATQDAYRYMLVSAADQARVVDSVTVPGPAPSSTSSLVRPLPLAPTNLIFPRLVAAHSTWLPTSSPPAMPCSTGFLR